MSSMNNNGGLSKTVSPLTAFNGKLDYMVANLQGLGKRQRQEDSFCLVNALEQRQYQTAGLMFCVCDGMGGMKDGKLASETAVKCLKEGFEAMNINGDIIGQLRDCVARTSDSVYSVLQGDGGSTVVLGVIYDGQLYYISVGDSFLYLYRNRKLIKINGAHNLCHREYLADIRKGDLNPLAARNDPESEALTSFLGTPADLEIETPARPIPLEFGDIIFACSDGVGGVIDEKEMTPMFLYSSVNDICRTIEQGVIAHAKPNQDNFTGILVKCY